MDDPKKFVKANFLPLRDTSELLEEFRNEVQAMRGRIMDIGCGPGTTTEDLVLPYLPADTVIVGKYFTYMKDEYLEISGTDISPEMIEYAEEHKKDKERVSFFQLNIETPELPSEFIGNYDNVVSFFCLHWCNDTTLMSNNIYKLLPPGGTGLILFLSDTTPFEIYLKYQENSKYSVYMQNAPSFVAPQYGLANPEESLRKDLEEAGFEVMHCTNRWKTFAYESLKIFLDALMSVSPFFNQMPENLQKDYRNDVAREIKKKYSIDDNDSNSNQSPVVEKYAVLVAYFKKPMQK